MRYGKWAELAHEVAAFLERPMIPTRIGAMIDGTIFPYLVDDVNKNKIGRERKQVSRVINHNFGLEIKYSTTEGTEGIFPCWHCDIRHLGFEPGIREFLRH